MSSNSKSQGCGLQIILGVLFVFGFYTCNYFYKGPAVYAPVLPLLETSTTIMNIEGSDYYVMTVTFDMDDGTPPVDSIVFKKCDSFQGFSLYKEHGNKKGITDVIIESDGTKLIMEPNSLCYFTEGNFRSEKVYFKETIFDKSILKEHLLAMINKNSVPAQGIKSTPKTPDPKPKNSNAADLQCEK